jgi:hypothetical protein
MMNEHQCGVISWAGNHPVRWQRPSVEIEGSREIIGIDIVIV